MESVGPRHVCKYLDLADRFVSVRRCGARTAGIQPDPELNRARYRRQVVQACIEEFAGEALDAKLAELAPDAPEAALELLYHICVSVNPELDIHSVGLVPDAPQDDKSTPEPRGEASGTTRRQDSLKQLRRRVLQLERQLTRRVVGQPHAVERVAAALRRTAAGLAGPDRPRASMLFLGATGTGKTELAKALQQQLYGCGTRPIVIDGSEYSLPHETARLLGAPPGYVGFEEGGILSRALRDRPESVVLFDEIEKAHANLHRLLLQVLDEGRLTDGHGEVVSFEQSIVILTSNAGAEERRAALTGAGFAPGRGDASHGPSNAGLGEIQRRALEGLFAPEFLGRLDEIVAFRDLDPSDALSIARSALTDLAKRVRSALGRVRFTPAVAAWVAAEGFSLDAGARELGRVVRQFIEPGLATALLRPGRRTDDWLKVSIRGGKPVITPE